MSRNTICCWIRDGKLPSYRTAGGKYLIRPVDLIGFMKSNSMFVSQALQELADEDEKANQGSGAVESTEDPVKERITTSKEPSILVVDDDANARALAVRTLQKIDAPILEAENGYEAMHMLTKHPEIALIILDLVMPGQDGVKTYVELRNQNISLPVIIITGYPPNDSEKVFGTMEPDLILSKPYQPMHLLNSAKAFMQDLGI